MHLSFKPAQIVLHQQTQQLIHLVLTFPTALRNYVIQMKAEVCAVPPDPAEARGSAREQLHVWRNDHGL